MAANSESGWYACVANSIEQLDAACQLRYEIFVSELRSRAAGQYPGLREIDSFDTLPTTKHVLVYHCQDLVATVRILMPNADVAAANRTQYGLDLEKLYSIRGLAATARPAEIPRSSVRAEYRRTRALALLYRKCREVAATEEISHFLATSMTETDSWRDANSLKERLISGGWWYDKVTAVLNRDCSPREHSQLTLTNFEPEKQTPLGVFLKGGARVIGGPFFDTERYCFAICVDFEDPVTQSRVNKLFGPVL